MGFILLNNHFPERNRGFFQESDRKRKKAVRYARTTRLFLCFFGFCPSHRGFSSICQILCYYDPMNDRSITISAGTIFKSILILILFYALWYMRDIVLVVLAAIVIASAIEPFTQWCIRHRIPRIPAVVGMYIIIGLLFACLLILFVPQLLNEAVNYLSTVPDTINVKDLWPSVQSFIPISGQSISLHDLALALRESLTGTTDNAFHTATIIFGGALSFLLTVIISFYLSVQEDGVVNFLRIVTPVGKYEYVVGLWRRSRRKIGLWLQGQLILCLIIGVLVYLGLVILGMPHALLLASLAALFSPRINTLGLIYVLSKPTVCPQKPLIICS